MTNVEKVKLRKVSYGNGIAIGAYGKEEDLQIFFNGLYNHGATVSEANFHCPTFAHVLISPRKDKKTGVLVETAEEQFKRGMVNWVMQPAFIKAVDMPHGPERNQMFQEARAKATESVNSLFENIEVEDFMAERFYPKEYLMPVEKAGILSEILGPDYDTPATPITSEKRK